MPRGISNRKIEYRAVEDLRQQVCNFQHAYRCLIDLLSQVQKCLDNESITAKDAEQARAYVAEKMTELQSGPLTSDKLGKEIWEEKTRFSRLCSAEENRKWRQERGLPPEE